MRIFGPLEARLQNVRPRRARRPQRRHLAAGNAQRSLAQPPDAPRSRPRSARAPHRPVGARLRAGAWARQEVILARAAKLAGAPTVTSRFVQRIAALAGEARWKEVLARGNSYLELARALDHPAAGEIRRAPGADAAARGAAARGCRSPPSKTGCAIPTPSTPDIFCACSRSMRSTRRRARATAAPSSTAPSATSPKFAAGLPADPLKELLRARRKAFRAAGRLSGSARVLVAALRAHRALVRAWDGERRAAHRSAACGNPRRAEIPRRQTRVHAVGHRRPHRAAQGRQLRHPRLQDRRGAHREAGAHGLSPATDAGSRHPARRRLQERSPPVRCPRSLMSR